jgi:hypothetical protein
MKNSDDFKPASSREYHAKRMMQKTACYLLYLSCR